MAGKCVRGPPVTSTCLFFVVVPLAAVLDNHLELCKSPNHGWVYLFRNMTAFPDLDLFNVKGIHRRLSGFGH